MGRLARRHLGGRLRLLKADCDVDGFFDRLAAARERVLLLDYDGTIAPFHTDPAQARPYPEVPPLLQRIRDVPGNRIMIVTGRRLEDFSELLEQLPHDMAWASHGWEWVADGVAGRHEPGREIREALEHACRAIHQLIVPGIRLETKIASVAVHWRGAPRDLAKRVRGAVIEAWEAIADGQLALLPFEEGVEIRARGHDKGDAVRAALACAEGCVCAYLGDDFTDEDALRAIRPHGLGVLVGDEPRETEAHAWIRPPGEVIALLERWAAAGA
jgi:trehalose 6-phosphate phosphatase